MLLLRTSIVSIIITVESKPDCENSLSVLETILDIVPSGLRNADQDTGKCYRILILSVSECFQLSAVFVNEGNYFSHLAGYLLLKVVEKLFHNAAFKY